jgi:formylmethanofuran dehydrogenase subunit C
MHKGTIISMKPLAMMPTFVFTRDQTPTFLSDLAAELTEFGINLPSAPVDGKFQIYSGDLSVSDKGEILIWQPAG